MLWPPSDVVDEALDIIGPDVEILFGDGLLGSLLNLKCLKSYIDIRVAYGNQEKNIFLLDIIDISFIIISVLPNLGHNEW